MAKLHVPQGPYYSFPILHVPTHSTDPYHDIMLFKLQNQYLKLYR
jgi:hypothetical protein